MDRSAEDLNGGSLADPDQTREYFDLCHRLQDRLGRMTSLVEAEGCVLATPRVPAPDVSEGADVRRALKGELADARTLLADLLAEQRRRDELGGSHDRR